MTPKFANEVFLTPLPQLGPLFSQSCFIWPWCECLYQVLLHLFILCSVDIPGMPVIFGRKKKKKRKSGSEWERRMGGVEDWREGRIQMECIVWDVWEKKTQKRKNNLKWNKITKMIIKFINKSGFHYSVFIFFLNWKR